MAHPVTPTAGEPPEEPHRTGPRARFPAHAVLRGCRAAVVLPAVLALGLLVVGDPALAGFAAFGAFASLVIASFGGSRNTGALAFALLLAVGGLMVAAGCLASLSLPSAVLVTLPVAFLAYYCAIEGPHGGSGATAALLGYVLAASTPAPLSELPMRVGGWCLGVAAGGVATLLLRAPAGEDSFRSAVSRTARALGGHLSALLDGTAGPDEARSSEKAVGTMLTEFTSGMHQPSGTRSADRSLTDVVGALLWAKGLIGEAANRCVGGLSRADRPETELLETSAELLCRTADFLDDEGPEPDATRVQRLLAAYGTRVDCMDHESPPSGTFVSHAFYTANIGEAAATTAVETLRAARRPPSYRPHIAWRRAVAPCRSSLRHLAGRARHSSVVTAWRDSATIDSIWFVNALRSAVAMALTIVVVHLAGLDRGFWALLGVLAVLRTSVASTGSRAVVALLGTVAGVVVGGVLIGLAGGDSAVMWAVFPFVVWLAAFSPGTLPDAVGQAAFTVVVLCLYTLLSPSGWQLGLVRLQDVAVGAAVSLLVGALMWPRGAAGVLRSNMAEVFRLGGRDLTASTGWALGFVTTRPSVRLTSSSPATRHMHDSLRGFLAEPASSGMERTDLCFLSSSAVWLRMTTSGLARQSQVVLDKDPDRFRLGDLASRLATFYTRLGDRLERADVRNPASGPSDDRVTLSGVMPRTCRSWWVYEYLLHLDRQAARLTAPTLRLAREPGPGGRWFGRTGPAEPSVRERSGEQW
ncbi:FUSC family protein [Streptomyces sp. WMMC940]|uniref:FUSC family protein n=1 Tax=Streptomyces sp. WMMC940 TaxID=3015153 RepID=UPI0022B6478D|nr:FUSC family protein [Streptomyces sp. WMMC940]MCZ7456476.1 FUSC family protein [Streptomyces sp. WMMC940]